MFPICL